MRPYEVTAKTVVVLAFKTVYTLEQKRRDNDKKIILLYVGMKDMMGVLLLYGSFHSMAADLHPAASKMWRMTSPSLLMAQTSRVD